MRPGPSNPASPLLLLLPSLPAGAMLHPKLGGIRGASLAPAASLTSHGIDIDHLVMAGGEHGTHTEQGARSCEGQERQQME